jgi:hypothetical protein
LTGARIDTAVEGRAVFANGEYSLFALWQFDADRARLFMLSQTGRGAPIFVPALPRIDPRKFADPPPQQRHLGDPIERA